MKQFFRNETLVKKSLFISYIVLGLLIIMGLFSHLSSHNSRSSTEDLFNKRFAVYQVTATVIKNVAAVHSNFGRTTRQAHAGFDEKEINLLVKEQFAALDGIHQMIEEALPAERLTPEEKRLQGAIVNNFKDYKESCISRFGLGTPNLRLDRLSVAISDDRFTELNRSLYDLLDLEARLNQETSHGRPRSLSAALGNLYPTFESSYRSVRADQPISRQAHNRPRE